MGWRDHIKVHKAAELFPMMSEPELRELGESIKTTGLKSHIKLHRGKLLDGRNRLEAMELAGLTIDWDSKPLGCPFDHLDEKIDPHEYVLAVNIHRRHLTEEQRRDLIAKLIKAKPSASDRSIAKKVKRDHKTVAKVRKKMESRGEVSPPEKRVGADGKRYKPQPKNKKTKRDREWEAAKAADLAEAAKHRVTGSQVIDLEKRKAQMAALAAELPADLSIPPILNRTDDEPAAPAPDQDAERARASRDALTSFKLACQDQLPLLNDRDWLEAKLFFSAYLEGRDRAASTIPDPNQGDLAEVWGEPEMEAAE